MNKKEFKSLMNVLDYLHEEKKDYEECEKQYRSVHVWNDILVLNEYAQAHQVKLPPLPLNETTPEINSAESIVKKQFIRKILKDINNLDWELEDDMIILHHKTPDLNTPILTLDAELFYKELWINKSIDPREVDCLGLTCILELEGQDYNIYDEWDISEIIDVFHENINLIITE